MDEMSKAACHAIAQAKAGRGRVGREQAVAAGDLSRCSLGKSGCNFGQISFAVVAAVLPAIFYFVAGDFLRRIISARLRGELFTASAFGKIFATSAFNTTTLLPRA